ncbi:unnamed protein product [Calicophoron daubneyi]|uniref:Uncharacterized protein n=1 Tax=Calicophoron daubneyi TaxID=300641 RepID=A0AAV2TNA9_CALDB
MKCLHQALAIDILSYVLCSPDVKSFQVSLLNIFLTDTGQILCMPDVTTVDFEIPPLTAHGPSPALDSVLLDICDYFYYIDFVHKRSSVPLTGMCTFQRIRTVLEDNGESDIFRQKLELINHPLAFTVSLSPIHTAFSSPSKY